MSKYSSICKTLGSIVLVLGIIGTLVLAVKYGKTVSLESNFGISYIRNWGLTFTYLIVGGVLTTVQSVVLFALGEMLDFISNINSSITGVYGTKKQSTGNTENISENLNSNDIYKENLEDLTYSKENCELPQSSSTKRCNSCNAICNIDAKECDICGNKFIN